MTTKNPIFTILGNVENRNVNGKSGVKTIYYQSASMENDQMRIQQDVEVDGPNMGYRVGEKLEWDVAADLVPGQFGRVELARRKTLRPVVQAVEAKRA